MGEVMLDKELRQVGVIALGVTAGELLFPVFASIAVPPCCFHKVGADQQNDTNGYFRKVLHRNPANLMKIVVWANGGEIKCECESECGVI
jgi:hypothetical protein